MELAACKLTHEQGLGGATCRVSREGLSLLWRVTCEGLAAQNWRCSSCLLGRFALLGFFKTVQHKPSGSLNFVETKIDGKEGEEQDSLGSRPARIEPVDNKGITRGSLAVNGFRTQ